MAIEFADGRVLACWALFVGPRFVPRDELLVGLECARDESGAVTGHRARLGVPHGLAT